MNRRRFVVLLALLVGVVFVMTAHAQWKGLGRVYGAVLDEAGAPLVDVVVTASFALGGGTEAKTDAKGKWVIAGLARGDWTVTVAKPGYSRTVFKVSVREMAAMSPLNASLKKL